MRAKALKVIAGTLGAGALPFALYFLAAFVGAAIPAYGPTAQAERGIEIFLRREGVHTDLVLPLASEHFDWTTLVSPAQTPAGPGEYAYVAFGWGDLGFFRNAPTWEDVTFKASVRALFLKAPSAIRVRFERARPAGDNAVALTASPKQYLRLAETIADGFRRDGQGRPQLVADLRRGPAEAFYRAEGSLSPIRTCNTWVNDALKSAELPSCLWTPFAQGLFVHSRR